jgi:hypothetical protein
MLGHLITLSHVVYHADDLVEMGRSIKLAISQGMLVRLQDSIYTITFWIKDIAVQRETVTGPTIK